jgi:hypothetical protein
MPRVPLIIFADVDEFRTLFDPLLRFLDGNFPYSRLRVVDYREKLR